MDYEFFGLLGAMVASSGVAGYAVARIVDNRTVATLGGEIARLQLKVMTRDAELARVRNSLAQYTWDLDLVREQRDDLFEAAKARTLRLKEAGRKGALVANAKKAAAHKDAAATTIAAFGKASLRPRDEVVAGVAENRRRKLQSGGGVASQMGG